VKVPFGWSTFWMSQAGSSAPQESSQPTLHGYWSWTTTAPAEGSQTSVICPSGVKWRTESVNTISPVQSSPPWYFASQP